MIYTTGTIAINGNTVTGTGTNFSAPLSLIRVGCTLIAIGNPVQIFTITEIKGGTELSVTPAANPAIPAGTKFSILLSDSISVDGLAQDVAETLRYYQSKETQIEEAIEFFKNFDLKQLQDLTNQVKGDAEKTADDRSATEQMKNDTQQIKDSAVSEMNQIKGDVSNLKNEAISARDSAQQYMTGAQSANNAAETAKNGAVTARNEAEEFAKSLNAENLLRKDANLSDLSNIDIARQNMRVDTFDNVGAHTFIYSPDRSYRLVIRNDGLLVYQNGDGTDTKPFEIGAGGTGSTTVEGARNNLGLGTLQDVQFKSITATDGDILVPQAHIVGCKTNTGGNKNIYLTNLPGESAPGGWVNLLQGNFHDGYWQFGGVRGDGTDLKNILLYINPNKPGYPGSSFRFIPETNDTQASGYVESPRGFVGRCRQTAWAGTYYTEYVPFYAETVENNDAGWVPIVCGGSQSQWGYHLKSAFGIIANNQNWPDTAIHMLGDNAHNRMFLFSHNGSLVTVGNGQFETGNYDFAKNPTSDRDLKKDIVYTDGKESYDRVMQWLPTMFKYKRDDIQRYGLIAQDMMNVDPQYVKLVPGSPVMEDVIGVDENGEEYVDRQIETDRTDDTLALDSNVMLTDMACAMVYMGGMIQSYKDENDLLRANAAVMDERITNLENQVSELVALVKQLTGSEE